MVTYDGVIFCDRLYYNRKRLAGVLCYCDILYSMGMSIFRLFCFWLAFMNIDSSWGEKNPKTNQNKTKTHGINITNTLPVSLFYTRNLLKGKKYTLDDLYINLYN